MPFDIKTAKPIEKGKFDITTAKPIDKSPSWLPDKKRTEKLIAERPKAEEALMEEVMQPWEFKKHPVKTTLGAVPRLLTTGLKTLAVPWQRAEAAIANPLMELQETQPLPPNDPRNVSREVWQRLEKERTKEGLKSVGKAGMAFWKGLTGERRGELGDIPRRTGFPELASKFIGFGSMIGLTNVATRGSLISSAKKGERFIKTKMPRTMSKNFVYNRSRLAADGLDELYGTLSKEYDDVLGKIGNRNIDPEKVTTVLEELPEYIINRMKRELGKEMAPTIETLKKMKGVLRKSVPSKVWSGRQIGNEGQGIIKDAYYRINNLMTEGNDELIALNRKYRDFMNMRNELARVIYDEYGNVKSKGLEGLFKQGAERNKQIFFEKFADQWPQAKQIMKDIIKFTKRQSLKRLIGRGALVLGGYELGRRTIVQPLLERMQK